MSFAAEAYRLRSNVRPEPGTNVGLAPVREGVGRRAHSGAVAAVCDRRGSSEVCRGGHRPPLQQGGRIRQARAFTLIELLLTVTLLLLLLGAVVFSFSNLRRGSSLDEGVTQLEALLRFARAQAASTGHQVRVSFEEDLGDGLSAPLGNLHVLWEPDPLIRPGIFEELREAEPYVRGIGDLISIEDVRPLEQGRSPASETADRSGATGQAGPAAVTISENESSDTLGFAPITFYPDGSSDSAEIVLASKDQDDERVIGLQFVGVIGTFRRRLIPRDFGPEQSAERPAKASETTTDSPLPAVETGPVAGPSHGAGTGKAKGPSRELLRTK